MRALRLALVLIAIGCGASVDEGPRGRSGVVASKRFGEMTRDDAGAWCDWLYGSTPVTKKRYGESYECEGYTRSVGTRDECVARSTASGPPSCPLTVGDAEACFLRIASPCLGATPPPECRAPAGC